MPATIDTRLNRLRERAERALASGRRGGDVMTVLETMTREAPDGSVHALFAHRHLAEMQLEGSPWRAALHLRRVIDAGAADDGAHALMGLCQALLGNYRAAVSAYPDDIPSVAQPGNALVQRRIGHGGIRYRGIRRGPRAGPWSSGQRSPDSGRTVRRGGAGLLRGGARHPER